MTTSTPAPGYYGNSGDGFGGGNEMTHIQQMISVRRRGRDEREEEGRGVELN